MESNGDAFLPELPVLGQTAEWSLDQVAPEPLSNILPEGSDASQDAPGKEQQPNQHMAGSELGSVDKAVEQFQLASAQLFQQEQPPPPPQPTEESVGSQLGSHEMSVEPTAVTQDSSQGNCSLHQALNTCTVFVLSKIHVKSVLVIQLHSLFKGKP